jgi:hypothetical protein
MTDFVEKGRRGTTFIEYTVLGKIHRGAEITR